jgi:hypothetical protein
VDLLIEHESGRMDLNTTKEPLLFAFFAANGWSEADARSMAARIADWKDPDDTPREGGAELQEYLAAQRLDVALRCHKRALRFQSEETLKSIGCESLIAQHIQSHW